MWKLVVSKPENHNLRLKTAINTEFNFNIKKKHYFITDIKLKVDQIRRKLKANFNKPFFI